MYHAYMIKPLSRGLSIWSSDSMFKNCRITELQTMLNNVTHSNLGKTNLFRAPALAIALLWLLPSKIRDYY